MTNEPLQSQAAWNRFADQLKEVGERLVGPTGAKGPRERAEAFRFLLGLLSAAQDLEVEVDRAHPKFTRMFTSTKRSFIADGIDTLYHEAKLDSSLSYEAKVRRGDDIFFSIVIYSSDDEGMRSMASFLIDKDIEFESDVATIHISAEQPLDAKNWLELKGDQPFALTRQYFTESVLDVDNGELQQATMTIKSTDPVSSPQSYTPDDLKSALDRAATFVNDTVDSALGISAFVALNTIEHDGDGEGQPTRIGADGQMIIDEERYDAHTADEIVDMIDPKVVANNLPGPGIDYVGASYKLADDEIIVVEGKKVPCRYWSCQLLTHFLQCGDYRHHRVSLNDRQVHYDDDGSFRIYASRNNPGVKNWLDTEGRRRGQIVFRTLLAEGDMDPQMSVIKIADIRKADLL